MRTPRSGGVMAIGWFQKATAVFGRRETSRPQPFEFTCDCGGTLNGYRADGVQKPTCPACGATNFVLPACPLPVPKSLREAWYGEPIVPPIPKPETSGTKSKSRTKSKSGKQPAMAAAPVATPRKPSVPLAQRLRIVFTPVRLILLAILATVALTGAVMVRSARLEWARTQLEPAIERGKLALKERDFTAAATAFDEAGLALDRLGRKDAAALAVRQLQRETGLATQLSSRGLVDVLGALTAGKKEASLPERFQQQAAGAWLVFDAVLTRQPTGDGDDEWCLVDVPMVLSGDQPLTVAFAEVPWPAAWKTWKAEAPRRIVFAAQLDSLELPGDRHLSPVLWLRSASAVLWCHTETFEALTLETLPADEAVALREVLQGQRVALGLEDAR